MLIWGFTQNPDEATAVPMGFAPCFNGGHGSWMLVEPLIEILVNQDTGERVRAHWMYQMHVNAAGSVTPHSRVSTLMSCTPLH